MLGGSLGCGEGPMNPKPLNPNSHLGHAENAQELVFRFIGLIYRHRLMQSWQWTRNQQPDMEKPEKRSCFRHIVVVPLPALPLRKVQSLPGPPRLPGPQPIVLGLLTS